MQWAGTPAVVWKTTTKEFMPRKGPMKQYKAELNQEGTYDGIVYVDGAVNLVIPNISSNEDEAKRRVEAIDVMACKVFLNRI